MADGLDSGEASTTTGQARPDPEAIAHFTRILFEYADGSVPVRLFAEKGGARFRPETPFEPAGQDLAAALSRHAARAASRGATLYVVPGTVSQPGKAGTKDITQLTTVLIDLDDGDIGAKCDHLAHHLGKPALEVASGGTTSEGQRKQHLYWRLSEPAEGDDIALVCGLRAEIARKAGGDPSFASAHQPIRVAGSIHAKGGTCRPVEILDIRDHEVDLAEFAEAVVAMPVMEGIGRDATKTPGRGPRAADLMVRKTHEAGVDGITRFTALSKVIGHWLRRAREGRITLDQAWDEVLGCNLANIVPPWDEDRLRREFERLRRIDADNHRAAPVPEQGDSSGGPAPPASSDDALAALFAMRYAVAWRHVAQWGRWLAWTGAVWRNDETRHVRQLIRLVCRESAAGLATPREARRIASAATIAAVERIARADPRHAATTSQWDTDPNLLNTPIGVVNLVSGKLAPHDSSLYMTRIAGASPGGDCPRWQAFLNQVCGGNPELVAYLARMAGYCLTGSTGEQVLFFLYGTGANGKSVFLTVLAAILGDYTTNAPIETFVAGYGDRHPTELAGLAGARLVTVIETEEGRRWAESRLKAITGGDRVTARFMRQDFFEFRPQFKLVIAGNHKPAIRSVDEAMRRRFHLIPFDVTIAPENRDPALPGKLLAERAGILRWAITGCAEWRRHGLAPPPAVTGATEEYFEEEDAIRTWLADRCVRDLAAFTTIQDLFADWKTWAESAGERPYTNIRLSKQLVRLGLSKGREQGGARGFEGLRLASGPSTPRRDGDGR